MANYNCDLDSVLCESSQSPFLTVIANVLESVVRGSTPAETIFDARRRPSIPIYDYLRRWMKYTRCGANCVVAAVVLIDRVCKTTNLTVTEMNVHRFLMTTLTIANKYCLDVPFRNSHYAQVGGVSLAELNELEKRTLVILDFGVQIGVEEFDCYVEMFRNHRSWPDDDDEEEVVELLRSARKTPASAPTSARPHLHADNSTDNGLSDTRTSFASRGTETTLNESRSSLPSKPAAGTGLRAVRAASPRRRAPEGRTLSKIVRK
eukprot:Hpha_TRINITY_DN16338_c2_g3::TRINITY_DN16338_c2_g3_i1::g.57716::m.57716